MIMQEGKLSVSSSPHIFSGVTTRTIMMGVTIALLPTLVASAFIFGWSVLLLTAVTVAACVGFEALWCFLMKKPMSIGDLSAVVTGLILAFNLPPAFPLWMAVIGAFISIIITKQLFGGLGLNFANPALVGRMVLQLSFTGDMITYVYPASMQGVDILASSTPLYALRDGTVPLLDMLLGTHAGVLGETCAITLIMGGVFMIATRIISPLIPAFYIGGTFLFTFLFGLGDLSVSVSLFQSFASIFGGGLLLGAFFMATDYTTSPYTRSGKIVYGLILALFTATIRQWSNAPEGVSYALLLANLIVPYINSICRQRPMGIARKLKKSAEKEVSNG